MTETLTIRPAQLSDLTAVDDLLQRSYPRLLAADYPPSVMVLALPIISRARPDLLTSGRYFLALGPGGKILGAGGWSRSTPGLSDRTQGLPSSPVPGDVRHVATDPSALRQGVGRAVMMAVFQSAREAGVARLNCLSTRTAVPFYASLGFRALGAVDVPLRAGIAFPAIWMTRELA